MSKIIDKLKGLENDQVKEEDLEYIEIIDEDSDKKKTNFFKITIIFIAFIIALYGGFKLAFFVFSPKKYESISEKTKLNIDINSPKQKEDKKVSTPQKKELRFVVFSGGKNFEKYLLEKFNSDPKNPNLANNLAVFYFEQNDVNNALKYAQKALTTEPDNPYFWNTLGIVLTELKLYEDAEKCFKKAIEKKPEEGVFYYNLANLYEREDKNILARENYLLYLSKSDKINPKMLEFVREKLKKGV